MSIEEILNQLLKLHIGGHSRIQAKSKNKPPNNLPCTVYLIIRPQILKRVIIRVNTSRSQTKVSLPDKVFLMLLTVVFWQISGPRDQVDGRIAHYA